jgi:hypothetical protein
MPNALRHAFLSLRLDTDTVIKLFRPFSSALISVSLLHPTSR